MITIEKWAGLATNASPYSIPPGAASTQVNLQVISPGQLTVRPGAVTVGFATAAGSTAPTVRAMRTPFANVEKIIHQNNLGQVYVSQTPYPEAIQYPLRALHAGGILRYTLGGVTQYVSPTYDTNGLASPTFTEVLAGIADLAELGSATSPATSVSVDIAPAQAAYIADNPTASFVYASIEAVLVDARNIIFGWGINIGTTLTVTAHVFPETSTNWVVPNGGGGANAYAYPINPYLPLRPYEKLF